MRAYDEPFFGSGANALAREVELAKLGIDWAPGDTVETVNDADPYVTNFWRATTLFCDQVAVIADYPVMEADLHARHQWLVDQVGFREKIFSDPEYFDVKVAGWWVWGLSCWIGAGWCCFETVHKKRPHLPDRGGKGVHTTRVPGRGDRGPRRLTGEPNRPAIGPKAAKGVHRQIPRAHALGGMGVHGHRLGKKLPNLSSHGGRMTGVVAKRPHLSGTGGGVGVHGPVARSRLIPWFRALRERLRPVRFVCGDFERITGKSVVLPDHGFGGLFLDPPYPAGADRHEELYSVDCGEVAHRAHQVALAWGSSDRERDFLRHATLTDSQRKAFMHPIDRCRAIVKTGTDTSRVRVAFCGYEGTHEFPDDWEEVAWSSGGGYGGGQGGRGERNKERERIWFSPACLDPRELVPKPATDPQLGLRL